jgi:hypothetical protein
MLMSSAPYNNLVISLSLPILHMSCYQITQLSPLLLPEMIFWGPTSQVISKTKIFHIDKIQEKKKVGGDPAYSHKLLALTSLFTAPFTSPLSTT